MKILRLMGYPLHNFSSLERFILYQAIDLTGRGEEVEVGYDGIDDTRAAQEAQAYVKDVRLHFDFPNRKPGLWLRLKYFVHALKTLRAGRYDIVHTYFDPSSRVINNIASFFPRTKFIRTQGTVPDLRSKNPAILWLKKLYWRFNCRNQACIICVSQAVKRGLVEIGIPKEKCRVVYNVTDMKHFRPNDVKPPKDYFGLTFVGRLVEVKELHVLIEGLRLLVTEHGRQDIRLNLVGIGELEGELKALTARHGLDSYIQFAGQRSDIAGILNEDTDVYVTASRLEGLPCAVLEAMACGLPVIASNIPEHGEIIEHEVNGLQFRLGDAADFATCVLKLAASDELRKRMGGANRQRVESCHSLDTWVAQEYAVYRDLLAERRSR